MRTPRVLSTLLLGIAGAGTVLALASGAVTGAVFHAEATTTADVTTAQLGLEFGDSFQHESIALSADRHMQRTEIALTNTSNTGRFPLAIAVTESQATDSAPVSLTIYDGTCALRSSATAEGAIWSWGRLGDAPSGPGLGDATAPTIAEGATRTFCAEFSLVGTPTDAIELSASLSFTGWVSTFITNPLTWTMPVTVEAAGDEPGTGPGAPAEGPYPAPKMDTCTPSDSLGTTGTFTLRLGWHYPWTTVAPDSWEGWDPERYLVTWSGNIPLAEEQQVQGGPGQRVIPFGPVDLAELGVDLEKVQGTFTVVGVDSDGLPTTRRAIATINGISCAMNTRADS